MCVCDNWRTLEAPSFKALGDTGNSSKHSGPPFMLRRVCQNKAFSHVCHLCQNMEPLEVVVLPLSISLWLILRNEPPSPFIHSAGVLEEKDGAKEDWRTSYSMKRKRKLCHLLKCLSVSLTFISSLCTYYRHLHILKVKLKLNDAYICFENYRPPIFNLKTNPEWFFFLSYHGSPPPTSIQSHSGTG